MISKQTLLPAPSAPTKGERLETLLEQGNVRVERILSGPHSASGPYDQEQDEWVALLQGHATLEVAGAHVDLQAGEALWLPAHTPHRVVDTSEAPPCVWLAVHIASPR
jgi:cupin 2 domain-containing protein